MEKAVSSGYTHHSEWKIPSLLLATQGTGQERKEKASFSEGNIFLLILGQFVHSSNAWAFLEQVSCTKSYFTTRISTHRSSKNRQMWFRLYNFTLPRKYSKRKGDFTALYNSRSSLLLQELCVSTMPHKLKQKCYPSQD